MKSTVLFLLFSMTITTMFTDASNGLSQNSQNEDAIWSKYIFNVYTKKEKNRIKNVYRTMPEEKKDAYLSILCKYGNLKKISQYKSQSAPQIELLLQSKQI